MKYFAFAVIFLFFIGLPLLFLSWYRRSLSRRHYAALAAAALDKGQGYYATPYLRRIVDRLLKLRNFAALEKLLKGETAPAAKFLAARGYSFEAAVLEAFSRPSVADARFQARVKSNPADNEALAELAKLSHLLGKTSRSRLAAEKIGAKATAYASGIRLYFAMLGAAADGDLQRAVDYGVRANRRFAKSKAWYEEARSLVFLGTVYRVSSLFDAAYIMYKTAENIGRRLKSPVLTTEALANLGMLMMTENRFSEAADFLAEAAKTARKHKLDGYLAELGNQRALLKLLTAAPAAAERYAQTALERHTRLKNRGGQAFSYELLSHAAKEKADYPAMVSRASQAEAAYKGSDNISAYLESMYLRAEGLFLQAKNRRGGKKYLESAETVLRRILMIAKKKSGCFHAANAYTLLGLIFLRRKEYARARALFNQSLALEQKDERITGIAADFANIGLTEKLCGNREQARKNLQAALEYAAVDPESDFYKQLQQRLVELD